MDKQYKRRIYQDTNGIDLLIEPVSTNEVEEYEFCIVQTESDCRARFEVLPSPNSKSKVTIYIYAEGNSKVDCVCTLKVPKHVAGAETDIQIRSWPFDRARINARPEMFIENSDVIAAHGNALGTLDAEQRYYLATKGIDDYKQLIKESLLEDA